MTIDSSVDLSSRRTRTGTLRAAARDYRPSVAMASPSAPTNDRLRLAELMAALSLATDLGNAMPLASLFGDDAARA